METLEYELLEINIKLAVKEVEDALRYCSRGEVVETRRLIDRLLDIRRLLTP